LGEKYSTIVTMQKQILLYAPKLESYIKSTDKKIDRIDYAFCGPAEEEIRIVEEG
jgi:hypothetical protein